MAKTDQLRCEAGNHDWHRPSKRGRKPKNCPEHSDTKKEPAKSNPFKRGKQEENLEAAREESKRKHNAARQELFRRVEEANLGNEHKRQADYIVGEMKKGRSPSYLTERLDQIMKEYEKSRG